MRREIALLGKCVSEMTVLCKTDILHKTDVCMSWNIDRRGSNRVELPRQIKQTGLDG